MSSDSEPPREDSRCALGDQPFANYDDPDVGPFPCLREVERLYQRDLIIPFRQLYDGPLISGKGVYEHLVSTLENPIAAGDPDDPSGLKCQKRTLWRRLYRTHLRFCRQEFAGFIGRVNREASGGRVVVFLSINYSYKALREALALKKKGYRCFFIVRHRHVEAVAPLFEDAFEAICQLQYSWLTVLTLIRQLRPQYFHVHCSMWHSIAARIVIDHKRSGSRCICEFDDMTTVYASRGNLMRLVPHYLVDLDFAMEGYALRNADGILHQLTWRTERELHERHGGLASAAVMHPYPSPAFISASRPEDEGGKLSAVWAGNVWRPSGEPRDLFISSYLIDTMAAFLRQGVTCHILLDPSRKPELDLDDESWRPYRELEPLGDFEFRWGTPLNRLAAQIQPYSFGIAYFPFPAAEMTVHRSKWLNHMPNKLFGFIEAGLPVLMNREFEFAAKFVEQHGLGLVLGVDEIEIAAERMRTFDQAQCRARIHEFRERFSMDLMIDHVIAAYKGCQPNPATPDPISCVPLS